MKKSILFVSNCFGEDRAASFIASELKKTLGDKYNIFGASLISNGSDYKNKGIDVIYSSEIPPSGGFPTKSLKGFVSDLFSGSLNNIILFKRKLLEIKEQIDILIVVGDVFLLYLAKKSLKPKRTVFLALAKSDYFMPHYWIEKLYIKKNVDYMLTRDAFTKENLRKDGINAYFLGNPLVDGLEVKDFNLNIPAESRIIGILPGSRKEAVQNFEIIIKIIEELKDLNICFLTAISDNLDYESFIEVLKKNGYDIKKSDVVSGKKLNISLILAKGFFSEIINRAEFFIGLAGTANEQAVALGKPVLSFVGSGVQSNYKRMKEQEKLLGGAIKFVRKRREVAKEILFLLNNKEEVLRRGKIGKERMGESGGSKNIAEFLAREVLYGIQ
ncbi:MAG: lipid-A-disaccharide synthase-related protein [Brevinematales bacterium]|nr:lipid-A-disaccharide synthase-related protein [Brevinematales bacterium]